MGLDVGAYLKWVEPYGLGVGAYPTGVGTYPKRIGVYERLSMPHTWAYPTWVGF